jgi:hypothetical protein
MTSRKWLVVSNPSFEEQKMVGEKDKPSGWKRKIIHEMTEYWLNFVFLVFVFFIMTLYRRLLMAEYHIAYLNYGFAVIQAAILAKVILLAEVARVGQKHEDKPLIIPTLHKTIVFALWVVGFKVLENLLEGLVHGKGLSGGFDELISKGWYELLANSLVVIAAFIPFFAIKQLGRVLGRETLVDLFFRGRAQAK